MSRRLVNRADIRCSQLNSISLSKNILRSLQSVAGDMPTLDKFPKAHIVTFEYYVGIIHFLEEDYAKVPFLCSSFTATLILPNPITSSQLS